MLELLSRKTDWQLGTCVAPAVATATTLPVYPDPRCRSRPAQRPIFPGVIVDVSILALKMRQPINLVVHK